MFITLTAVYVDNFTQGNDEVMALCEEVFVVSNLDGYGVPMIINLNNERMQVNQQLTFLQEKIQEIGSAIFFNQSDAVLKLPTSIVNTLSVDDYGFVWFYIQKPKQDLREFDKEFPVRLDFFRKGIHYFLQVTGKAYMVIDPEEMNILEETLPEDVRQKGAENVLVKVKILKAEYHDTSPAPRMAKTSWWQNAMSSVYTWFRQSHGSYQRPNVYHPASVN